MGRFADIESRGGMVPAGAALLRQLKLVREYCLKHYVNLKMINNDIYEACKAVHLSAYELQLKLSPSATLSDFERLLGLVFAASSGISSDSAAEIAAAIAYSARFGVADADADADLADASDFADSEYSADAAGDFDGDDFDGGEDYGSDY